MIDGLMLNMRMLAGWYIVQGQLPGPTAKSTLMVSIFILANKFSKCPLHSFDVKEGGFEACKFNK